MRMMANSAPFRLGCAPKVGCCITSMTTYATLDANLAAAAEAIRQADALLIGAGAGMGVDSGLPDFRGPEGFWKAYPPYRALGLRFEELASPHWFERDPPLAWG